MSKDYTHIKANGLRNELKDLTKAVKQQTKVHEDMLELIFQLLVKQTHQHEKTINCRHAYCSKQRGECECSNERNND